MSRLLISAIACLVLWFGVPGSAIEQATPASRPNVLLMFPEPWVG